MDSTPSLNLVNLHWCRLAESIWTANLAASMGAAVALQLQIPPDLGAQLALLLMLVSAWQALCALLDAVNWPAVLASWRSWQRSIALPSLPYATTDSDAERARQQLALLLSWVRDFGAPQSGGLAAAVLGTWLVIFVIGGALGPAGFGISAAAVLLAQAGVWLSQSAGRHWGALAQSALSVGLPLLLAHTLFAPFTTSLALMALSLALALAPLRICRELGYGSLIALLLATRQPVGAFLLALVWLPQAFLGELRGKRIWQSLAIALAVLTLG